MHDLRSLATKVKAVGRISATSLSFVVLLESACRGGIPCKILAKSSLIGSAWPAKVECPKYRSTQNSDNITAKSCISMTDALTLRPAIAVPTFVAIYST